jgi:hypothetical protein
MAGMSTAAVGAATGGLAILAGAAVYGGYKLLTMKSSSEKLRDSLKNIDKQTNDFNKVITASIGVTSAAGESQYNYAQSIGRVSTLKKQLNALEAHGGKNTAAYKAKLEELNLALNERAKNESDAQKYNRAAQSASVKLAAGVLKTSSAHSKLTAALKEQKKWQKQVDENSTPEAKQMLRDATNDVAKAQATYNRELEAQQRAQRAAAVNAINYERTLAHLVPVAGKAGDALAKVYKRAPNTAQTIALKFADPKDAGAVAAKASKAIHNGVKTNIVMNIVAHSKDAEDAIRKLNAMSLNAKEQKIITSGGKEAIAMLEKIIGRKLNKHELKIAQQGGPAVISMLNKILGIKIPRKQVTVSANTQAALSAINAVLSRMGQLRNKAVYIDTYFRTHGNATPGGQSGTGRGGASRAGGATGRTMTPALKRNGVTPPTKALTALDKRIEWAANSASANTKRTQGGRYSRPTFLVGEQNRPEYVIATNPAYRKRNKGILANAARDMGYQLATKTGHMVTAAATGISSVVPSSLGKVNSSGGFYANTNTGSVAKNAKDRPPFHTTKYIKREARKKKTSPKKLAFKQRRGWAGYIEGLQTQQGYLEREVSIRESEVREPEDMVIQTGTQDVKDPTTGEVTKVPVYAPNPAIESEYKPDLKKVDQAYQMLVAVVKELVTSIPKAIQAINVEKGIRAASSANLKDLIEKENHRFNGYSKKEKASHKAAHDKRISKLTSAKKDEDDTIKDLLSDRKDLVGAQAEAGFDFREYTDDKAANLAEYNSAEGKAQTTADTQNTQEVNNVLGVDQYGNQIGGGSDSGSGGGSDGPTLAQQTGLADTERANILRDFGGNMGAVTQNGAASPAQGVAQNNLSGLGKIASAMTAPVAAAVSAQTTALTGGSAGSALSGGLTAGSMMAAATPVANTSGTMLTGGTGDKTVNIVNNFAAPPADPHSWTQGVEFEANAAV